MLVWKVENLSMEMKDGGKCDKDNEHGDVRKICGSKRSDDERQEIWWNRIVEQSSEYAETILRMTIRKMIPSDQA